MNVNKPTITIICVLFVIFSAHVTVESSQLNFSVQTITPENQYDKEKSYFDLMVKTGQEYILQLEINNISNKEIIVEQNIYSAKTNSSGVIEYGENNIKEDKSLTHNIVDLVTLDREVIIPAKSIKNVNMKLTAPSEYFDGIIVGGLNFKEKITGDDIKKYSTELNIENSFSYTIAIVIRQNEKNIKKNIKLLDVKNEKNDGENTVFLNLQNPTNTFINNITMKTQIYYEEEKKPIAQKQQDRMQMAPNTLMTYPIPIRKKNMKSGKYKVNVNITSNQENWQLSKSFIVLPTSSSSLNNNNLTTVREDKSLLYLLIGTIVLTIIKLGGSFLFKTKKYRK